MVTSPWVLRLADTTRSVATLNFDGSFRVAPCAPLVVGADAPRLGWLDASVSDDRRIRAELAKERARRHARDRAELGDEMGLVVVAGCGGDAPPARVTVLVRGVYRAMEAREPGERLRADADGFTEYAAEAPLAHAEVDGDGVHVGARQPVGGVESELRPGATLIRDREAFGDRALQDLGFRPRFPDLADALAAGA